MEDLSATSPLVLSQRADEMRPEQRKQLALDLHQFGQQNTG